MPTLRLALPFAILRSSALARLPARLLAAQALARSRRSLGRLDDHILRDIGLTREQAESEAHLPAWDAPMHWKG
ncbi:DUF1127 domain-containing protein [Tabrizicola sp.]|uniref:DUF1127 domain-containing protein n=1 Tax=Tabrizicola sp. TaxID=2005166 RepID=UPI002736BEBB|nr:DUF1127 domain-containing protein [Tabrizicola sp.]MDP3195071.1 DUF1127 domain-containing protein [Tabrizicola sp.]